MITYELAKKLKEAGFSQKGGLYYQEYIQKKGFGLGLYHKLQQREDLFNEFGELVLMVEPTMCPNLSELIEACGDDFDSLCRCGDLYQSSKAEACSNGEKVAGGFEASSIETEDYCVWAWGDSAEEAVAKLWLELNKK